MSLILLLLGTSALAMAQDVSIFTGGDKGEGLDLRGQFPHAVNIMGPDAGPVGNAEFLSEQNSPNVSVTATQAGPTWANSQYGGSEADNNLETVMNSIRWSAVSDQPRTVTITAGGLAPGAFYKLQLLFTESCCNRAFAIEVEGNTILEDFSINAVMGIDSTPSQGVVVTYIFKAGDNTMDIVMDGINGSRPDRNPHVSGFTVERLTFDPVPFSPATWMLLAGLLGLAGMRAFKPSR